MKFLSKLQNKGLVKYIDEPVSLDLEMGHVAYIEVKKHDSKVLVFTNPIDKNGNKIDIPVIMNIFANSYVSEIIFDDKIENIASNIRKFMKFKPTHNLFEKLKVFLFFFSYRKIFPKKSKKLGDCQHKVYKDDDINLDKLPILKTWADDAGEFITMGQVYTQSLDKCENNLGLYRLQKFSKNELGMHFQIHKDASNFFYEYKKAKKIMPVSIAIGGDPLYTWCGQAPLPKGIFELLLYGFIRKNGAKMVKSLTNDIFVPADSDIIIEGYIDTSDFKEEGPFGDHTGYYTLKDPYPYLKVTAITMNKDPMFYATVVGKPPLEDKYMGYATETIFKPLLQTSIPDLLDYHMPENGVFHNFLLAKIKVNYSGNAKQIAHAMWGIGQMSFIKHIIMVDESAPNLTDYKNITRYICDRFDIKNISTNDGILDALDHSSNESLIGGKLLVDCSNTKYVESNKKIINDKKLLQMMQELSDEVITLKQYMCDTATPITVVAINKIKNQKEFSDSLKLLTNHIKVVFIVDNDSNDVANAYMLLWRITNNIDVLRDLFIYDDYLVIDATNKSKVDGFMREWPGDVYCSKEVLTMLKNKKIVDIDDYFIKKYQLLPYKVV